MPPDDGSARRLVQFTQMPHPGRRVMVDIASVVSFREAGTGGTLLKGEHWYEDVAEGYDSVLEQARAALPRPAEAAPMAPCLFIVEADAFRDAEGRMPLPRLIGPFPSRLEAERHMFSQGMLWGSWEARPLTAPGAAAEAVG